MLNILRWLTPQDPEEAPTTLPTPELRRLVVGDIHGEHRGLLALLRQVGAIDAQGNRRPGWWLMQVGDLIHGGHDHLGDTEALRLGLSLFDVLLLGNHELPHAYPEARFPRFRGQTPLPQECQTLLDTSIREGRFSAATVVDGWLVTHAGVHPAVARAEALPLEATACASEINTRFARRAASSTPVPLFDGVGRARGGNADYGGIFWLNWDALRTHADENAIPQIVGHTPHLDGPEQAGPSLWCVDVGASQMGRVGALLKNGLDGHWLPAIYLND